MTKSIAVAAATAAAVAALTAGGAGADAQGGARTIDLISVEQHCGGADNGRRGPSLGDLDACRGHLATPADAVAGRTHWTCLYLGSSGRARTAPPSSDFAAGRSRPPASSATPARAARGRSPAAPATTPARAAPRSCAS